MKKRIYKYAKGDKVPSHIMRCTSEYNMEYCDITFGIDVIVDYNKNNENVLCKIYPVREMKDESVIIVKNTKEDEYLDFKILGNNIRLISKPRSLFLKEQGEFMGL